MPKKVSDGRGWFFESQRHALAAKGVKTGRKEQPKKRPLLIGRYAERWPKKKPEIPSDKPDKKPLLQQVETDPGKKWFWGIRLRPSEQKEAIREAVRRLDKEPTEGRSQMVKATSMTKEPNVVGISPSPSKATVQRKSKSRKVKYPSIEDAWEAARSELAARYGDDASSSSGVVKDESEMEQKLARNMGVH